MLARNRALLTHLLREHLPQVIYHQHQASYLAWLDCRALGLTEDPAAFFLREAKVAVNSGLGFGPEGEGFVRINTATTRSMLEMAVTQMAAALHARSPGRS
jgi:cysteine-S-conjugate beta-lyase